MKQEQIVLGKNKCLQKSVGKKNVEHENFPPSSIRTQYQEIARRSKICLKKANGGSQSATLTEQFVFTSENSFGLYVCVFYRVFSAAWLKSPSCTLTNLETQYAIIYFDCFWPPFFVVVFVVGCWSNKKQIDVIHSCVHRHQPHQHHSSAPPL